MDQFLDNKAVAVLEGRLVALETAKSSLTEIQEAQLSKALRDNAVCDQKATNLEQRINELEQDEKNRTEAKAAINKAGKASVIDDPVLIDAEIARQELQTYATALATRLHSLDSDSKCQAERGTKELELLARLANLEAEPADTAKKATELLARVANLEAKPADTAKKATELLARIANLEAAPADTAKKATELLARVANLEAGPGVAKDQAVLDRQAAELGTVQEDLLKRTADVQRRLECLEVGHGKATNAGGGIAGNDVAQELIAKAADLSNRLSSFEKSASREQSNAIETKVAELWERVGDIEASHDGPDENKEVAPLQDKIKELMGRLSVAEKARDDLDTQAATLFGRLEEIEKLQAAPCAEGAGPTVDSSIMREEAAKMGMELNEKLLAAQAQCNLSATKVQSLESELKQSSGEVGTLNRQIQELKMAVEQAAQRSPVKDDANVALLMEQRSQLQRELAECQGRLATRSASTRTQELEHADKIAQFAAIEMQMLDEQEKAAEQSKNLQEQLQILAKECQAKQASEALLSGQLEEATKKAQNLERELLAERALISSPGATVVSLRTMAGVTGLSASLKAAVGPEDASGSPAAVQRAPGPAPISPTRPAIAARPVRTATSITNLAGGAAPRVPPYRPVRGPGTRVSRGATGLEPQSIPLRPGTQPRAPAGGLHSRGFGSGAPRSMASGAPAVRPGK